MSNHAGVRIGRSNTDDAQSAPENRSQREIPAPHEAPENGAPAHALTRTALDRFLDKIIALDPEQGECWIWQGAKDPAGYGRFHIIRPNGAPGERYSAKAYRWAYEHWNGPIPEGYEVHHICEVPLCVNPDHLQALTPREHTLSSGHRNVAALNAAKTHCKRGHAFDDANTYWISGGRSRACRTCKQVSDQRSRVSLASRGDA